MKSNNKGKQQPVYVKLLTMLGSRRQRLTIFTLVGLICSAGAVIATRAFSVKSAEPIVSPSPSKPAEVVRVHPLPAAQELGKASIYVSHAALWSQLQDAFRLLGNRLEKPGKERVTLSGTMEKTVNGESVNLPFRLIWQLPGRLRLEEYVGGQAQVTVFDGTKLSKLGGTLSQQNEDELETLLYDSAEHFFVGRSQGQAIGYLGGRFTASGEEDGLPAYELYEVVDQIRSTAQGRQQIKHYYINSDSQLLEKVGYTVQRKEEKVEVEVQLSKWNQYQDQRFPGQIVRLENGKPVLSMTINAVSLNAKVEDGIFASLQR